MAAAEKLYDMGRLETGKSTTNVAYAQVDPKDNEAIKKFLEEWTAEQLSRSTDEED